jgi:hypothetical protein
MGGLPVSVMGVVLKTPHRKKLTTLQNISQGLGLALIFWYDTVEMCRHRLERSGSGYRQVAGASECGNEPSATIKCGQFLG